MSFKIRQYEHFTDNQGISSYAHHIMEENYFFNNEFDILHRSDACRKKSQPLTRKSGSPNRRNPHQYESTTCQVNRSKERQEEQTKGASPNQERIRIEVANTTVPVTTEAKDRALRNRKKMWRRPRETKRKPQLEQVPRSRRDSSNPATTKTNAASRELNRAQD